MKEEVNKRVMGPDDTAYAEEKIIKAMSLGPRERVLDIKGTEGDGLMKLWEEYKERNPTQSNSAEENAATNYALRVAGKIIEQEQAAVKDLSTKWDKIKSSVSTSQFMTSEIVLSFRHMNKPYAPMIIQVCV